MATTKAGAGTAAEKRAAAAAAKDEKKRIADYYEHQLWTSEEKELEALNADVQNARYGSLAATKAHASALNGGGVAEHAARLRADADATLFSLFGQYHHRAEAIRRARAERRKTNRVAETRT